MTDINIEIFKRYQPKKKLEIIESLTDKELLNLKESTVIRIVKETGTFNYGSKRNMHLNISHDRRIGNDWNSTFDGIDYSRGKIFVELYLQYENTDTSISEYWYRFLQPGDYKGQYEGSDRMGNPRTYYYTYYESDKAKCIKSILLEYVYSKYPNIQIYYRSEEPGEIIYETNDVDGKSYFPERYILDFLDGPAYFNSLEEAAEYVSGKTGKNVATEDEIETALDELEEREQEENDVIFYSFHKFTINEEDEP